MQRLRINMLDSYQTEPHRSCYRCQTVAPNIRDLTLLHRLKKRPYIDPIGSQRNNVQEGRKVCVVKGKQSLLC
jgi:hypothetical protein